MTPLLQTGFLLPHQVTYSCQVGIVESALFSNSAWILYKPADLPFFNLRTATLTSFSVIILLGEQEAAVCYITNRCRRWFCAVHYILRVLLPSFQLFFVGFCESPIFHFDLLALYFFACEILYNPVNCFLVASLCSLLGFAGFEIVPCLLISTNAGLLLLSNALRKSSKFKLVSVIVIVITGFWPSDNSVWTLTTFAKRLTASADRHCGKLSNGYQRY